VIVATDDERIMDVIKAFDLKVDVMMTSPDHESGTDRMAEVAEAHPDHDLYINVQGDMPFLDLNTWLNPCLAAMDDPKVDMATPVAVENIVTPNFSRSTEWRHVGIYAYRPDALAKYYAARTDKKARKMEKQFGLEQIRARSIGLNVKVVHVNAIAPLELNTKSDLDYLNALVHRINWTQQIYSDALLAYEDLKDMLEDGTGSVH